MRSQNLLASLACVGSLTAPLASAWFLQVHNQIGYIADQLLNRNTQYMLAHILEPEYKGSVGRAAAWADTVSKGSAPYSYNWHWISARDDPPTTCNLHYNRDCQEGGCVVSQIANQTSILDRCVADLARGQYRPDINCQQALKWLIHFIGDVCEPMHTSLKAYGGNTFKVKFNGTDTNLHQTWDRWILYSQTGHMPDGFSADTIDPFFQSLYQRIRNEQNNYPSFHTPLKKWAICDFNVQRGTYCGELWARDSNSIVCDYCYGKYKDGEDLFTSGYAAGAFYIVEQQLAKAAWRTAGWLNTIAKDHLKGSEFGGEEDVWSTGNPIGMESMGLDSGDEALERLLVQEL